jgi:ribosomal protein S18 acetylase RimI-like enzyme
MTIREAKKDDLEKLCKLNYEIFADTKKFDSDVIADYALTEEGKGWIEDAISNPKGCCFIAEEEGQMVGYTSGVEKGMTYRKGKYFELVNIGLIPEMRGKGLGEKLLRTIEEWAKEKGYNKVYLNCYFKNRTAIDFYNKHGYEKIEISMEKRI